MFSQMLSAYSRIPSKWFDYVSVGGMFMFLGIGIGAIPKLIVECALW